MRINDVILKEQQLSEIDFVTDLTQARQQKVQADKIKALAGTFLQQWGKKVVSLTNASGGQPVADDEYNDHLKDYVQKVMLNDRTIDQLDTNSQNRIDAGIDAVMKNRNDRQALPQAFNQLVTAASVARDDPAKTQYQPGVGTKSKGKGGAAQPLTPPLAKSAVAKALKQPTPTLMVDALKQVPGAGESIPRTPSVLANALLKAMGFQVT